MLHLSTRIKMHIIFTAQFECTYLHNPLQQVNSSVLLILNNCERYDVSWIHPMQWRRFPLPFLSAKTCCNSFLRLFKNFVVLQNKKKTLFIQKKCTKLRKKSRKTAHTFSCKKGKSEVSNFSIFHFDACSVNFFYFFFINNKIV